VGLTRRQALSALTLSALPGTLGCMRQLAYRTSASKGAVFVPEQQLARLVTASDALRVHVDDAADVIVVSRDDGGYRALLAVCTHNLCPLDVVPDGYDCTCHGSRFDLGGVVLSGPASEPLKRFDTRVEDGGLFIALGAV
jgi:cytochrome b6-f complex iron-sulfur subunit